MCGSGWSAAFYGESKPSGHRCLVRSVSADMSVWNGKGGMGLGDTQNPPGASAIAFQCTDGAAGRLYLLSFQDDGILVGGGALLYGDGQR